MREGLKFLIIISIALFIISFGIYFIIINFGIIFFIGPFILIFASMFLGMPKQKRTLNFELLILLFMIGIIFNLFFFLYLFVPDLQVGDLPFRSTAYFNWTPRQTLAMLYFFISAAITLDIMILAMICGSLFKKYAKPSKPNTCYQCGKEVLQGEFQCENCRRKARALLA